MTRKIIQYYRKNQYGKMLEYVANQGDAQIIAQLTGKKTIDGITRELLRDLMGTEKIEFVEIIAPN